AKSYLLQPKPEAATLQLACASARRALESAPVGDANLPWFRTVAGIAAFREDKFAEADTLLGEVVDNPLHENQRRLALAFRAMARWRAGRVDESHADLSELAKLNLSLPERTRVSAVVKDPYQLAIRLACDEADALLRGNSATNH